MTEDKKEERSVMRFEKMKIGDVSDIKLLSEPSWDYEVLESILGKLDVCLFGTAGIAEK